MKRAMALCLKFNMKPDGGGECVQYVSERKKKSNGQISRRERETDRQAGGQDSKKNRNITYTYTNSSDKKVPEIDFRFLVIH